uniref:Uncharacterized protein n=1 Tax=Macaca fascicularis TaxID=9541 RepID=Q9GMK6_MACFA|nr:hypothetical protein [Macaca fascicularis]
MWSYSENIVGNHFVQLSYEGQECCLLPFGFSFRFSLYSCTDSFIQLFKADFGKLFLKKTKKAPSDLRVCPLCPTAKTHSFLPLRSLQIIIMLLFGIFLC